MDCTVHCGRGLLGAEAASSVVWATLQGTGTQLRDARAKKEQLAARVQDVQAMLAMDTGRLSLLPAPASLQPALSSRALMGDLSTPAPSKRATRAAKGNSEVGDLALGTYFWSGDKQLTKQIQAARENWTGEKRFREKYAGGWRCAVGTLATGAGSP